MNELTGRYVNVVLSVEEGKGMEFLKHPVTVVANFNDRLMESDPAEPEDCPAFNTELVWEIEKRDLRKVRSLNTPLRVECITVDGVHRKERVGFALLSLRSAPIIPRCDRKREIPFHWQKLIGVAHEHKSYHPELYLSLTIRDNFEGDEEKVAQVPFIAAKVEEELVEVEEVEQMKAIPLSYLEDGFIQVGESGKANQSYLLSLVVKVASNLDVLLPEVLVFNQIKEKYHISFTLFGISLKSKPLYRELHDNIILNEKIVISLLSTYDTLKEFFCQHHQVQVNFHSGKDKLGTTKVDVEKLLCDKTEDSFDALHDSCVSCEEKCYFKFPSPNGVVPQGVDGRMPFIEVRTVLQRQDPGKKITVITGGSGEDAMTPMQKKLIVSPLEKRENGAAGDQVTPKSSKESTPREDSVRNALLVKFDEESLPLVDTEISEITVTSKLDSLQDDVDDYRHYCLEIAVRAIRNWKNAPKTLHFEFKHPKARSSLKFQKDLYEANDNEVQLDDMVGKIHFFSTREQITSVVKHQKVEIVIKGSEQEILEIIEVDTTRLDEETLNGFQTVVELEAEAQLVLDLQLVDCGSGELKNICKHDLLPAILDDRLLAKQVAELQEWKELEKAKFNAKLKQRERKHLTTLQKEWLKKKNELETKLNKSVTKCKILTQELKLAANSLRIRNAIEGKLCAKGDYHFEEEMQKNISKYSSYEYNQLVERISKLEQENQELREIIEEQNEEILATKKSALTKEQTATLLKELRVLEEQFEEAQKQKSYFKDQWKKAVEEIHELKTEDQKQILSQIQMHKKELSEISLDAFYNDEDDDDEEKLDDDDPNEPIKFM